MCQETLLKLQIYFENIFKDFGNTTKTDLIPI